MAENRKVKVFILNNGQLNYYTNTLADAIFQIPPQEEWSNGDKWSIRQSTMAEEDLKDLPEFDGF